MDIKLKRPIFIFHHCFLIRILEYTFPVTLEQGDCKIKFRKFSVVFSCLVI